MSSKPVLKLDWCDHKAAKYAVEHWHYSKRIPTGKCNWIGVWEDGRFIGTVIYGLGATPSLCLPYKVSTFECCELVRVALGKHASQVSRIIAISLRMIKKKNDKLRICVSFADPFNKHHGGIYQAGGWIYSGQSSDSEMYKLASGEMAHPRRFTGQGWNAPKAIPSGAEKIKVPGKHRYLFPLDEAMRKQILPLAKPYPKRAQSKAVVAPGVHPGEGGSTPTCALQSPGGGT